MQTQVVTTITTIIEVSDDKGIADIKHGVQIDGGEFGAVAGMAALEAVVGSALISAQNSLSEMLPQAYGDALRKNVEEI